MTISAKSIAWAREHQARQTYQITYKSGSHEYVYCCNAQSADRARVQLYREQYPMVLAVDRIVQVLAIVVSDAYKSILPSA